MQSNSKRNVQCSCCLTKNLEIEKWSSPFQYIWWQFVRIPSCQFCLHIGPNLCTDASVAFTSNEMCMHCICICTACSESTYILNQHEFSVDAAAAARFFLVRFSLWHTNMSTENTKYVECWKLSFQSCVVASVYSVHMRQRQQQQYSTFFILCSN